MKPESSSRILPFQLRPAWHGMGVGVGVRAKSLSYCSFTPPVILSERKNLCGWDSFSVVLSSERAREGGGKRERERERKICRKGAGWFMYV